MDQDVIQPLLRSADFVRVLRTRTQANSVHFAVHHMASVPSVARRASAQHTDGAAPIDLSTGQTGTGQADSSAAKRRTLDLVSPVDLSAEREPDSVWFGAVVPKRHAKRSVTRSLLKRQIRNVVARHGDALACGLWVVRLRAPFDRKIFTSAASDQLKAAARDELDLLLVAASRRAGRANRVV